MSKTTTLSLLLFYGLCAVLLALILQATGGHFTYTLDDPYIHLALAENLPGHYGVYSKEISSPSSSALYPWLLMPLASTVWGPLLLNFLAAGLCVLALAKIQEKLGLFATAPRWCRVGFIMLLAVAINLFGLVFMGMEHSLHMACVLITLLGWLCWSKGERVPNWVWPAIILAPLFRFEALGLSLLTLATFIIIGPRRAALLTLAGLVAACGLYRFYMTSLGLGFWSDSILTKSPVLAAISLQQDIFQVLIAGITDQLQKITQPGYLAVLCSSLLLAGCALLGAKLGLNTRQRWLLCSAGACGIGHILFGQFSWLGRYHAYVLALQLPLLLWALQPLARHDRTGGLATAVLVLALGSGTVTQQLQVPLAAQQIYEQHTQLHRFLTEYWQAPVAAVDIGQLTWQADYPVADLVGLASPMARQVLLAYRTWPEPLLYGFMKSYGASLIITYDHLFDRSLSAKWIKVGELSLSRPRLLISPNVSFFLTDAALWPKLYSDLEKFRAGLPPGVTLLTAAPPAPPQ